MKHKYSVGQLVDAPAPRFSNHPAGVHEIISVVSGRDGEWRYRIRSRETGSERETGENALRDLEAEPKKAEAKPPSYPVSAYLTLPVRISVLAIVALLVGLMLMPALVRHAVLLKAALVVGYFLPAIGISLAVWWLTFSKIWLRRALVGTVGLTVALLFGEPFIHKSREIDRSRAEAAVNSRGPNYIPGAGKTISQQFTELEMVEEKEFCALSENFSKKNQVCYTYYLEGLSPYTARYWDKSLLNRLMN